ncbi:DNA polymerase III subunit gamma/tau [Microbacterium sp. C7(2022)]|uniref:DNA polymerase III subunit gamma/tau n=1 Tax=Microbacterium sp. C7(2022) TaxID=2992759 RepID=UPI00237AB563|nr:DNA polymerase III subunit gamma/tau [Microbacterium sp. C7(2022)]MDE0545625.1 DNA polymerase III subunit gamma/tau [Microbacterium sp. C7(2022)]
MSSERDDALRWDGDDDPTLDAAAATAPVGPAGEVPPAVEAPLADNVHPAKSVSAGAAEERENHAVTSTSHEAAAQAPLGNAALVTLGVVGGAYALYTVGWVIGGLRLQGVAQYLVADVMFVGSLWLAVMAPALWFGTTFVLTRNTATWIRILCLVAGLALLVPWPFVMIGAWGQ